MKYISNGNNHLSVARLEDGELKLAPIVAWKVWDHFTTSPVSVFDYKGAIYNRFDECWWTPDKQGRGEDSLIQYLKGESE